MPDSFVAAPPALILVVDDDPAQRLIFKETLANAGYRIEEAADGNEALEKARATAARPPVCSHPC